MPLHPDSQFIPHLQTSSRQLVAGNQPWAESCVQCALDVRAYAIRGFTCCTKSSFNPEI